MVTIVGKFDYGYDDRKNEIDHGKFDHGHDEVITFKKKNWSWLPRSEYLTVVITIEKKKLTMRLSGQKE